MANLIDSEIEEMELLILGLWDELTTPDYDKGIDDLDAKVEIPLAAFLRIKREARQLGFYVYMLVAYMEREKRQVLEDKTD